MTPIQEIRIDMSNGDIVDVLIYDLGGSFRADFDYRNGVGPKLDPHAGPTTNLMTAFSHMVSTVTATGAVFGGSIAKVHNPNNTELLSLADQTAILRNKGINAPVT